MERAAALESVNVATHGAQYSRLHRWNTSQERVGCLERRIVVDCVGQCVCGAGVETGESVSDLLSVNERALAVHRSVSGRSCTSSESCESE